MRTALLAALLFTTLLTLNSTAKAAEYFVSLAGNDSNTGLAVDQAFRTVQKGVNALQAGDTLTIEPGEYFESVHRKGLGSAEQPTIIRARIRSSVLIRGDVPVSDWKKVEGTRFAYVTKFDKPVQAVNEVDTLRVLRKVPNIGELDAAPNRFFYDASAGNLYIAASDWKPADTHHYTAAVTPSDGLCLMECTNVTIDGLSFTGFHSTNPDYYHPPYRNKFTGGGSVWGILLNNCVTCTVTHCTAYMNGGGIGAEYLTKPKELGKGHLFNCCVAYGQYSQHYTYEASGIGIYQANGDEIRDCLTYRNDGFGCRFYILVHSPAKMVGITSWGNYINGTPSDMQNKADERNSFDRCIALNYAQFQEPVTRSIVPEDKGHWPAEKLNIVLRPKDKPPVDLDREFADPENLDFRLQHDSQFRGTGPDGKDFGPHAYAPNIFYVSNSGDDAATGLSVRTAWKSLDKALSNRKPGDTVYLLDGEYKLTKPVTLAGTSEAPITLRSRGKTMAKVTGSLQFEKCSDLVIERIGFSGDGQFAAGKSIQLQQCEWIVPGNLNFTDINGLSLAHCSLFSAFSSNAPSNLNLKSVKDVTVTGSVVDLTLNAPKDAFAWAEYNLIQTGWQDVNNQVLAPGVKRQLNQHARIIGSYNIMAPSPNYGDARLALLRSELRQAHRVAGGMGKPFGAYRDDRPVFVPALVEAPSLHSVSATTANVEFMTTMGATCDIAWGPTESCDNKVTLHVNHVASFSLIGLKPSTTYYFRIKSISLPRATIGYSDAAQIIAVDSPTLKFTTAATCSAPRTFYVANDGDDSNTGLERAKAFKTLQHAANIVNAGDTVLIAGGRYRERVRIRATGEKGAPITFRGIVGERAIMDGAGRSLSNGFVLTNKHHLNFDALYFVDSAFSAESNMMIARAADVSLYRSSNVQITRCFSDGRGYYSAPALLAIESSDVLLKNTVNINKMGSAVYLNHSPNVTIENTVFACPMIATLVIDNTAEQKVTIRNNVFTDMLKKKAVLNFQTLEIEDFAAITLKNNSFLLRAFPVDKRIMLVDVDHAKREFRSQRTLPEYDAQIAPTDSVIEDPQFAGVDVLLKKGTKHDGFTPDVLMEPAIPLDFNSYFVTNPQLIERRIGLEPQAFEGFDFTKSTPSQSSVTSPVK